MWVALSLAALAGFSTVIGSLLGVAVRKPGPKYMSFVLGFSAGVMLFISFIELLPKGMKTEGVGYFGANLAFFVGMGVYFLVDFFIPHDYMGQHDHAEAEQSEGNHEMAGTLSPHSLKRTALLVTLGISIHNFPEGMATFVGTMEDFHLGLAIAIAVAIHNIPEGLAISAPVYAATGSWKKGAFWSFLSGLSEVAGAVLAAIVLMPFLSDRLMGFVLAFVAGTMTVIALDELIPSAKALTTEHTPIVGVIAGMILMMVNFYLLG